MTNDSYKDARGILNQLPNTTNLWQFDMNAGVAGAGVPEGYYDIIHIEMSRQEALELVEKIVGQLVHVKDEVVRVPINGKLIGPTVLNWTAEDSDE